MNRKLQVIRYILCDLLSAGISWTVLYVFRKKYIEPLKFGYEVPVNLGYKFFLGLTLIPLFWIVLYYLTGYYKDIYRKSRLEDAFHTFFQTLAGVIIIFFAVILDDYVSSYKNYYLLFGLLFMTQFILTLGFRWILTSLTLQKIHDRKIGFRTIIAGGGQQAVKLYKDMNAQDITSGNILIGFVSANSEDIQPLSSVIPHLGTIHELDSIARDRKAEEVILALESHEYSEINNIINKLGLNNVLIKAVPSMYSVLTGRVRMDHLYGTQLIQLSRTLIPQWQENIKDMIDFTGSVFALALASPLILFIAAGIKITSPGPVIYSHERIGRFGKPFRIYKFRSMYDGAESNGPELSHRHDRRLTNFGRFLRKFRLDEIPNFINVLKGEMSLVGPRPEREFYIRKIMEKAPYYVHLHKVKPGITSWGQVKYGYAENVDQMIKRLDYDMLYIENMSLFTDFKILFYTFLTILRGRGI